MHCKELILCDEYKHDEVKGKWQVLMPNIKQKASAEMCDY